MEQKGSYYSVIPAAVLYDEDLSTTEKLLYGFISQLANATGYCFASNKYLAELLNLSKSTISRGVNNLVKKGYLKYEYEYEPDSKEIKERHLFLGISKNDYTYTQKCIGGIGKNAQENIKTRNIYKKDNTNVLSKEKTKRFVKPSVEDIEAYCKNNGYEVDAQYFIDYYESKGWLIGKSSMKDWKAAIRMWVRNNKNWEPKNKMPDFNLKEPKHYTIDTTELDKALEEIENELRNKANERNL